MNTSLHRKDTLPPPAAFASLRPSRAAGIKDKVKRGRDRQERGGVPRKVFRAGRGGKRCRAEKKFSSYPFGGNAVPKLLARFATESSRETRSRGNCRSGTGLSQLLAFDQLSLPPLRAPISTIISVRNLGRASRTKRSSLRLVARLEAPRAVC